MAMVLYTSDAVRRAIRSVFSDTRRRRVAVVAFVGRGAEAYLYNPDGLHLVCWPEPSATDPEKLAALIERGAKVQFAHRLHMKLYWAEGRGAVVTSANLSTNALGANHLHEVGVRLSSNAVDIDRVLRSIKRRKADAKSLQQLRRARERLFRQRGSRQSNTPSDTFASWYNDPNRASWKIATWGWFDDVPAIVREVVRKQHGSPDFHSVQSVAPGHVKPLDWILSVRAFANSVGGIEWIHPDHVIRVPRGQRYRDPDHPLEAVQLHPIGYYSGRPFIIDERFRFGFRRAVADLGVDHLESLRQPGSRLLTAIWRHYARH